MGLYSVWAWIGKSGDRICSIFSSFFLKLNAKLPYGYFKTKFGIGPRDKQKLNFEWETEIYMGPEGATYDQWLDRHQSWSWLGQGIEGEAAMGGYSRAGVCASHLSATYFCYWGMMKWWSDDAMPYRSCALMMEWETVLGGSGKEFWGSWCWWKIGEFN